MTDQALDGERPSAEPLTAFNATKLSATAVAASFVPPPAFGELVNAQNAILTGPRGSGKTTLLKMLGSEALENWHDENAEEIRGRVNAVGVFVASDRTWNAQLLAPRDAAVPEAYAALAWSAFATHTFRSLVDAMNYRVRGRVAAESCRHLRVELGKEAEASISGDLCNYFGLDRSASSLPGTRELLGRRLAEIGAIRRALARGVDPTLPDWTDLDVLEVTNQAVFRFNQEANDPDRKWALLFDELELAPEEIVTELMAALRGDQPLIQLKLSLAPADRRFEQLALPGRPIAGQDYEHISLTYARKLRAVAFARRLTTAHLRAAGVTGQISIDRILGPSLFDSREDDGPAAEGGGTSGSRPYRRGSALWRAYDRLAKTDPTFEEYLVGNHLDLEDLDSLESNARAAKIRKIRNVVVTREYFRGRTGTGRSRKSSELYAGAASMMSLPDGNPRMIIALVNQIFPLVHRAGSSNTIPRSAQARALDVTLARFRALLQAQEPVVIDGEHVSLSAFLDDLGDYLGNRLVEEPFSDNISLTFVVDRRVRDEIKQLVVRGINAGALVYVPSRSDSAQMPHDIVGSQFRLSYLLCAQYGLPIHLTRSTSLSSMIRPSWAEPGTGRRRRGPLEDTRGTLFADGVLESGGES